MYLNDSYCAASMRDTNSTIHITCPASSNHVLPSPGFYTVTAYQVYSNGSIFPYPVYTKSILIENNGMSIDLL